MKRECGTQMEKVGVVYMDPRTDVEMEARDYFTSDQWEELRLSCVMTIQCYVRGWFARRRATAL